MTGENCTQTLVELGLTALEAEAYGFLIQQSPATGYKVAQAIGKPAANTYKALESLARKGAVLVDEAENRLCRAVPADEWLGQLERQFQRRKHNAAEALATLGSSPQDDRLYQLHTRTQVLERARAMLLRCKHSAVMDIFPVPLTSLTDDIEVAAARGVEIVVKTYLPIDLREVRVIVRPHGHEITEALPGDMISLNIDGVEHLLAVMPSDGDRVFQAIWTGSAVVSFLLYNGLINEASQAAIMAELDRDTTVDKLRRVFQGLRHLHPVSSRGPAYQNLLRRIGSEDPKQADNHESKRQGSNKS